MFTITLKPLLKLILRKIYVSQNFKKDHPSFMSYCNSKIFIARRFSDSIKFVYKISFTCSKSTLIYPISLLYD